LFAAYQADVFDGLGFGAMLTRTQMPKPPRSKTARRSDARDNEVGRRVRTQRLAKGLSQTELGEKIGVTFQQVQKYEKGTNRIGAGRLSRIAEVLEVPVTYFFPSDDEPVLPVSEQEGSPFALLSTSGAIQLVRAYSRIQGGNTRAALVQIAEHLAEAHAPGAKKPRKG
jgi:transcriptional regulator with XRE-family HTH domain